MGQLDRGRILGVPHQGPPHGFARLIGAESQTSADLPVHLLGPRWAAVEPNDSGRRWLSSAEVEGLRRELVRLEADTPTDEGSLARAIDLMDYERQNQTGVAIELPSVE